MAAFAQASIAGVVEGFVRRGAARCDRRGGQSRPDREGSFGCDRRQRPVSGSWTSRPGTYSVTFTLPGFNTFKRDGIELAGVVHRHGRTPTCAWRALEETITVSGEAPVVDVQNVTQQRVLGKEVLDAIPVGRSQHELRQADSRHDGSARLRRHEQSQSEHAVGARQPCNDQRVMVDGMSISATSGNGQLTNFIPDMTSTQEVAVSYSAGTARAGVRRRAAEHDSARGRQHLQGVVLRHGRHVESFQGNNYCDELPKAAALRPPDSKKVYDVNPGVGGPLVRDKLWFYSAARWQAQRELSVAGLWENKNAGNLDRVELRPRPQPAGRAAARPAERQHAPDVAGVAREQGGGASTNTSYRVGADHADHRAGVGDEATTSRATSSSPAATRRPSRTSWLFDATRERHHPGLEGSLPSDGGSSLEFTKPLPDVFQSLDRGRPNRAASIRNLLYRGAGQTGLGPFLRVTGYIASAQASAVLRHRFARHEGRLPRHLGRAQRGL